MSRRRGARHGRLISAASAPSAGEGAHRAHHVEGAHHDPGDVGPGIRRFVCDPLLPEETVATIEITTELPSFLVPSETLQLEAVLRDAARGHEAGG